MSLMPGICSEHSGSSTLILVNNICMYITVCTVALSYWNRFELGKFACFKLFVNNLEKAHIWILPYFHHVLTILLCLWLQISHIRRLNRFMTFWVGKVTAKQIFSQNHSLFNPNKLPLIPCQMPSPFSFGPFSIHSYFLFTVYRSWWENSPG